MTARVLHSILAISTAVAVLVAALAVFAYMDTGSASAFGSDSSKYNPITSSKFCNALSTTFGSGLSGTPGCTENLATGAAADYWTHLDMDTFDQLNFSNVVTFAPKDEKICDGYNAVSGCASFASGIKIGGLESQTYLGLANAQCNSHLDIKFILYTVALPNGGTANPRATTDPNHPGASTNIVYPRIPTDSDRFGGWHIGSPPASGGGTPPTGADAVGTDLGIANYPSYLLDTFDPDWVSPTSDGPALPVVPLAVYGGIHNVVGTWVPLYFAQFASTGASAIAGHSPALPAPLSLIQANQGQPSVSVLNDPTSAAAAPSGITDFCTFLDVETMLLGSAGGWTRATNPASIETGTIIQYDASQRDLDQDGVENSLDACPATAPSGVTYDGRSAGGSGTGDTDGDGIPDACDPTPAVDTNSGDHDSDIFLNRQDNCPLVANGTGVTAQIETELTTPTSNADNGPSTDSIGDACDTGSVTVTQNGHSVTVALSTTVANGRYLVKTNIVPKCFGGNDVDGDGYCGSDLDGSGNDCSVVNAGQGCASVGACAATSSCAVAHGVAPAMLLMDSDGDGFSDAVETYIGTDATKKCAQDTTADNEGPLDNWPLDLTHDDGKVTLGDITPKVLAFNLFVNQNASYPRLDISPDGKITLGDITPLVLAFNSLCTPTTPFQQ